MAFYTFKQIEVGSISAGDTATGNWTADDDYVIHKIYIKEATETEIGTRFLNVTLRVDNYVFTKDEVRAEIFDGYYGQVPALDIAFTKGKTFYYSITNEHGSSPIAPYIVLELHKP